MPLSSAPKQGTVLSASHKSHKSVWDQGKKHPGIGFGQEPGLF